MPADEAKSLAFLSYAHADDCYGDLTNLRDHLSREVRISTGEDFPIFQDRKDIGWGQNWKERILDSIDASTFLIPVLSPSFFKSQPCRDELTLFLARETMLGRADLILPIYYVDAPVFQERSKDDLARLLLTRQFVDWRKLRNKPLDTPEARESLAQLAIQIRDALERRGKTVGATGTSDASGIHQGKKPSRAAAGKEPPIRIVDAMQRGDHATISEAIRAAKPGDRILVRPGLYREGLVIDKALEIIGDGDRAEVVVQASGKDVILFQATMGKVANLTLRQTGGGDWFGIDITQGRLDLEDCDITSQSLSCVAIHGEADPRLRRNRIHDGRQCGVVVFERGRGTLEDNDIFGNSHSGVEIKDGADPVVRRNRFHDGRAGGVFVWVNGKGTLEDNDIAGNTFAGVEIREGGDPLLVRNRIHDSKVSGVFVWGGGKGTLEENEIFGNAMAGVEIREAGDPVLRRNRIHDGKQCGVFVYSQGRSTLEDNDIFGNAFTGLEVKDGGDPVVRNNRITKNGYEGVWVHEGGRGTFENNDLRENKGGPWDLAADCEPNVTRSGNLEE